MRVEQITAMPNALRQQQFYAGTHLALYPKISQTSAKVTEENENNTFKHHLEQENARQSIYTDPPSKKEKQFLEKRQQHADREEMMQRLIYANGVHYATNMLKLQLNT